MLMLFNIPLETQKDKSDLGASSENSYLWFTMVAIINFF
jgi:hypothetical protein